MSHVAVCRRALRSLEPPGSAPKLSLGDPRAALGPEGVGPPPRAARWVFTRGY